MVLVYKIKKMNAQELKRIIPIDYSYKPETNKNYVYFAVDKKQDYIKILKDIKKKMQIQQKDVITLADKKLKKIEKKPHSIKEILKNKGINIDISSFEVIKDIAIIDIPKKLNIKKETMNEIADAIMTVHPRVKTVLRKASAMEGEWRVRKLELIKGEEKTITTYIENGCRFKVDLSKMYYSTRLSPERMRIAKLVQESKKNEQILIPFAGYGPFAITIAKYNPSCRIAGIEINPYAVEYFKENIRLNKLENIDVYEGDARAIVKTKFNSWADRIIMPLPKNTIDYLSDIIIGAKDESIIHVYAFSDRERMFKDVEEKLDKKIGKEYDYQIINKRIVRPYSPFVSQVVMDIKIRRKNRQL